MRIAISEGTRALRGSSSSKPLGRLLSFQHWGCPNPLMSSDAHWRLAFGRGRRLVTLSTVIGPSSCLLSGLPPGPSSESRLSALADVIDRLSVDDDLLPAELMEEQKTGSLNRLEAALKPP